MAYSVDQNHLQRILIIVALWAITFLQCGILKSIGVLLPVLKEQFETYTGTVGIVISFVKLSGTLLGKKATAWLKNNVT